MTYLTAKKMGFKKGDFVFTGCFPGIIIGDVHTYTPTCEVWGSGDHEIGSVYSHQVSRLSKRQFLTLAKQYGFDGTAYTKAAKLALGI